jgi:hypothetical protein
MHFRTLTRLVGAFVAAACVARTAHAQAPARFTHADTLRGTNGPSRSWWDVAFYDLHVAVSPADSSVRGWNAITYRVIRPARQMQIDLMDPLVGERGTRCSSRW